MSRPILSPAEWREATALGEGAARGGRVDPQAGAAPRRLDRMIRDHVLRRPGAVSDPIARTEGNAP
ncbi:MAG: hypothetical protein AAFR79_07800 [Pseudomonadota bacterium]